MLDQLVEFLKRAIIKEKLNALARRHLAGGVLLLNARRAAACFGFLLALAELIELGKFRFFLLL